MDFIGKINDEKEKEIEIEKSQIQLEVDSFLFMGCWNKGYCKKKEENNEENDLYKTVESIKKYLFLDNKEITKPHKLFIAGDNYYPDKTKSKENKENKKKITDINNLNSGFECLDSINIDKYILFGNHDFEKTFLQNNNQEENGKECHNLTNQITKNNKIEFFNFKSYCLPHVYKNETLIVMIDSTMYDIKNEDDESLDCYKIINDNDNDNNMLKFIKNEQTRRANNLIDYYKKLPIKNIIFMAHHPIFGLKMKNDHLKYDFYYGLIELEMLFYDAFNVNQVNQINYYHFCADIHQFQVSKVTIKTINTINNDFVIKQYIVGTGGAEKDERVNITYENDENDKNDKIQKFYENSDKYIFEAELVLSLNLNGFMKCDILENKIHCSLWPNFVFKNNMFNKDIYDYVNNIDFYNTSISRALNNTNFSFSLLESIGGKSRKNKNIKSKKNKIKKSRKNHKKTTKKRKFRL